MAKLTIEKVDYCLGKDTMRISGLTDNELSELKSMEHYEAKEALLDMLDNRNDGIASVWHNGRGIYGLWFDNEFAYLAIGSSCD